MPRITLLLPALLALASPAWAAPEGIPAEALLQSLPAAPDGYERDTPEYEVAPGYTGEVGYASARYRESSGGTNATEYVLRLKDLGPRAGQMYQDYGADYLKGPVTNETQHSLTVKGQPALVTETSDVSMEITTFFAPGLVLSLSCINTDEAGCLARLDELDFDHLKARAADTP